MNKKSIKIRNRKLYNRAVARYFQHRYIFEAYLHKKLQRSIFTKIHETVAPNAAKRPDVTLTIVKTENYFRFDKIIPTWRSTIST